ncbi:MAG TPA: hypothetical protein VIU39_11475 [Anaerolineales bacterium]
MKEKLCAALVGALIVMLLTVPRPAAAHGEEPRLEVTPEALNPGMVLQVRGVGFDFEQQVTLVLTGGGGGIPLDTVTADTEGVFIQLVTIPADLADGSYVIHATTDDHEVDSPTFVVRGPAVAEGEAATAREEDDPLLAAMPTYAPGVSVTPMPKQAADVEPEPEELIIFTVIGALAGAGVLMVLALRRRQAK